MFGETLFYYEEEAGSKAGELDLRGCTVGPAPRHNREHCFQAAKSSSHYIVLCVDPRCALPVCGVAGDADGDRCAGKPRTRMKPHAG